MTPIRKALAGPLAGMAAYRQFLVYELRPKADGKTDKIPVMPSSWGNRDDLLTAEQAILLAESWQSPHGHGVGFVITAEDPFFFYNF